MQVTFLMPATSALYCQSLLVLSFTGYELFSFIFLFSFSSCPDFHLLLWAVTVTFVLVKNLLSSIKAFFLLLASLWFWLEEEYMHTTGRWQPTYCALYEFCKTWLKCAYETQILGGYFKRHKWQYRYCRRNSKSSNAILVPPTVVFQKEFHIFPLSVQPQYGKHHHCAGRINAKYINIFAECFYCNCWTNNPHLLEVRA